MALPFSGDAPPIEADEKFQETHEALVEMLTQQSEVYKREEHALRVLMEEEVMEKMHSHQKEGKLKRLCCTVGNPNADKFMTSEKCPD